MLYDCILMEKKIIIAKQKSNSSEDFNSDDDFISTES